MPARLLALLRRPAVAAGAAVAVLLAGTGTALALHHGTDRPPADTLTQATAAALPSAAATSAAPTAVPATSVPPPPRATASPAGPTGHSSTVALPARCAGPLPPGQPSDPSCDALHPHSGLPHPCISPRNACAWPDAHGAVPAGPYDPTVSVRGNRVHVTWTTTDLAGDGNAGPVHEFVLRLLPQGSDRVLSTHRLPTSTYATDFSGLAPGRYDVLIQELNDSGLSAGFCQPVEVVAPPAPFPTPSPSPKPAPPPSPSPTTTPS